MASTLTRPPTGFPIEELVQGLGDAVASGAVELLDVWLTDLCAWNAKVDLTAARTIVELTDLMIVDAIVASRFIPAGARVVDVGTGAGAPGLALGILRRDITVHLAEPLGKRASFLRTMIGKLTLDHVTLSGDRGETLARDSWDISMARATLGPDPWAKLGLELATRTMVFLAREALTIPANAAEEERIDYVWPLTQATRQLVVLARA